MMRTIDVKCGECAKYFNVQTTKGSGKIVVTCPHCHLEQDAYVLPKKIGEQPEEPTNRIDTMIPVRVLGKVDCQKSKYIIENKANINEQTCFICPKCNKPIAFTPVKTGEQAITCKDCGTKVYITACDPEEEALRKEREEEQRRKQEEEQRRKQEEDQRMVQYPQNDDSNETVVAPKPERVFTNYILYILQRSGEILRFRLFTGTTIVGRKDSKTPSDIQFDDPETSRRSVQLDVEMQNGVTTVILTVLKDQNPVLVNGIRVPQGDSVRLISETRIKMGQTELTFKKM